jgi:beta-glucosidase
VLLKNSRNLLPIGLDKYKTIAVIGENAVLRYAAGHGAAGVKAFREVTALEGILARVGAQANVQYAAGFRHPNITRGRMRDVAGVRTSELAATKPEEEKELRERALRAAKESDLVIVVGGLRHQPFQDDEGTDRRDLSLPARQDDLISSLVAVNPNTVIVLISGSPVTMPWLDQVPAVMQSWYGGSEGGSALAALLFGDANPSGKLPCTFPKSLQDSPAHATGTPRTYPGESGTVHYDEGLLVGYRWFDAKQIEPLFPFGFGLSYTTFSYANLKVVASGGASASVECEITNSGAREGAEVVQVYVQPRKPGVQRPVKELKGFTRVFLRPGETKRVTIPLEGRSFAYYAPEKKGWVAEAGDYRVLVGASSRDVRLDGTLKLPSTTLVP